MHPPLVRFNKLELVKSAGVKGDIIQWRIYTAAIKKVNEHLTWCTVPDWVPVGVLV